MAEVSDTRQKVNTVECATEVIRPFVQHDGAHAVRGGPRSVAQALADAGLLVTDEGRAVLDVAAQLTGRMEWALDEYGRNISVGLMRLGRAVDALIASKSS